MQTESKTSAFEQQLWKIYLSNYDVILDKLLPRKKMMQHVSDLINQQHHQYVVDCGCGSGYLGRKIKADKVLGLDRSDYLISKANQSDRPQHVEFKVADLDESLPVDDEAVDVIVGINTIYLLKNFVSVSAADSVASRLVLSFFLEAHRKLKSGGKLVIVTPMHPGFSISHLAKLHYQEQVEKEGMLKTLAESAKYFPRIFVVLMANLIIRNLGRQYGYRYYKKEDLIADIKAAGFIVHESSNCYDGNHALIVGEKS